MKDQELLKKNTRIRILDGPLKYSLGFIHKSKTNQNGDIIYWIVLDSGYCRWYERSEFTDRLTIISSEDSLIDYIMSKRTPPDFSSYFK